MMRSDNMMTDKGHNNERRSLLPVSVNQLLSEVYELAAEFLHLFKHQQLYESPVAGGHSSLRRNVADSVRIKISELREEIYECCVFTSRSSELTGRTDVTEPPRSRLKGRNLYCPPQ